MDEKNRRYRQLYDAIAGMPADVCRIIGQYDDRRPYSWNADRFSSPVTSVKPVGDGTKLRIDDLSGVWHVFVAEETMSDGLSAWTVEFCTQTFATYICVGLTSAERNWTNTYDSLRMIFAGPNDWMVGVIQSMSTVKLSNSDNAKAEVYSPTGLPERIRIRFDVDPADGSVRCRWTASAVENWNVSGDWLGGTTTMLGRLRPCVAMAGRMTAVVRPGQVDDFPLGRRELPVLAGSL